MGRNKIKERGKRHCLALASQSRLYSGGGGGGISIDHTPEQTPSNSLGMLSHRSDCHNYGQNYNHVGGCVCPGFTPACIPHKRTEPCMNIITTRRQRYGIMARGVR